MGGVCLAAWAKRPGGPAGCLKRRSSGGVDLLDSRAVKDGTGAELLCRHASRSFDPTANALAALCYYGAMRRGAIVMMDALGFRGIWRAYPDRALPKLQELPEIASVIVQGFADAPALRDSGFQIPSLSYTFLSDTIVICAQFDEPERSKRGGYDEVLLAGHATSAILSVAAVFTEPALAYRGCLAFGEFEVDTTHRRFLLGPAVDEAAELMEKANAAIVWMAPSAEAVLQPITSIPGAGADFGPWIEYPVPLKSGETFKTASIIPYSPGVKRPPEQIRSAILGSFDDPKRGSPKIEVLVKKQNTEGFLDLALKAFYARSGKLAGGAKK